MAEQRRYCSLDGGPISYIQLIIILLGLGVMWSNEVEARSRRAILIVDEAVGAVSDVADAATKAVGGKGGDDEDAPAATGRGGKVFDVMDHGAKTDDENTDNAMPFMKAWKAACKSSGPAKLVIPAGTYTVGQVLFQGPCTASKPIVVEVKGTLKAMTDISLYPDGDWFEFEDINGLEVLGGVWDGQGQSMWEMNDCKSNPSCQHLPVSIHLNHVTNAKIEGVTSINSMGFHLSTTFSSHINMHKLNISAPDESPNTDGIHVSTTDNLEVTDSVIGTGDDCLGIIQGATNITVRQVVCGPGHGISIGSLGKYDDEKDVKGVHVTNCTLKNTTNGVRIKSYASDLKLQVSDIIFEHIIMDNVKNPVLIDQNYGSKKDNGKASNVAINDVHFRKIKGTSVSENPISLTCSSKIPCKGIELADIELEYDGEASSVCINAKTVFSGKHKQKACE